MTRPWHIDAFDPLAGLCFASQRGPDLDSENPDLDLPAVYLAPPLFQPETASRVIAFSAAHGSFQLGLLIDGLEVAFPTLAALTEFVRRCYLSGGGTDGAGSRGPVPPPVPGGTGPEVRLEAESKEAGDSIRWVLRAASNFVELAAKVSNEPVAFRRFSRSQGSGGNDSHALAEIAALLILELWERVPPPGADEALYQFADALERLYRAVWRLGLLGTVLSSRRLRDQHHTGFDRLFPEPLSRLWYSPRTDPMDDLSCWPVPGTIAAHGIVSVRDHLLAVTGNPTRLNGPLEAALALFAACHLLPAPLPFDDRDDPVTRSIHSQYFGQAADWLIGQMPKYAYRPDLEKMIATVGIETTTGGDNNGYAVA